MSSSHMQSSETVTTDKDIAQNQSEPTNMNGMLSILYYSLSFSLSLYINTCIFYLLQPIHYPVVAACISDCEL